MTRHLDRIPPYVFYELDARRVAARTAGRSLLDVGIGSPDGPIPSVVVEAMQRVAGDRGLSGYPSFQATPAYREAVAQYMATRFGVSVDAQVGLLAVAGSKEGIAELILSQVGPGDVVLVPEVHYPVYARATLLAGADPVYVPFLDDGRLDLDAIDPAMLRRARILLVNYPSNPTTVSVSLEEMARYVAFAEQHGLLLISDLAYSELSFDGFRVPSVLQVPGADRVAVETHSCSKSFNMAGVRIGFVTGRLDAIARLDAYRSNIGYGVSTFAQVAGTAAFSHHAEIVGPIVSEYRARRDAIVAAFRAEGWPVESPRATMYLWLDVPSGVDDWAWVDALIAQEGIVVTPGIAFGEAGRGKFRISFVQPAQELQRAAAGIAATARQFTR
jgi:LL-diaminopimelate aminotransferase